MNLIDRIRWKRTLRTASSERLLGVIDGRDAVAVDLHFLPDGSAAGTVTVVEWGAGRVEHLAASRLEITLAPAGEGREATVLGHGPRWDRGSLRALVDC